MKKIIIVGLGPAGLEHITLKTWEIIGQAERLYLRTGVHPAAEELMAKGIKFQSFDHLYDCLLYTSFHHGRKKHQVHGFGGRAIGKG